MRLRLRLCIINSLLRLELFGFLQCPLLGSRNAAFNFRTDGGSGPVCVIRWRRGKGLYCNGTEVRYEPVATNAANCSNFSVALQTGHFKDIGKPNPDKGRP